MCILAGITSSAEAAAGRFLFDKLHVAYITAGNRFLSGSIKAHLDCKREGQRKTPIYASFTSEDKGTSPLIFEGYISTQGFGQPY